MSEEQKTEFQVKSEDLLKSIKKIIREGNVRKIVIKNENGKKLLEIPLSLGVIGALLLPVITAVGAITSMAAKFTVEVIKNPD
ncbi:MAG: DUF4342 domain-containing protein [Bacteroidetes bacterium]|nr:DUF4342 domain-containing protein [Bacteroidota bacterium]